jgi:hypothetical protein
MRRGSWEICKSKLAEFFDGHGVVVTSGECRVAAPWTTTPNAIQRTTRSVLRRVAARPNLNTLEAGFIARGSVRVVKRAGAKTKIGSTVIKLVSVGVVDLLAACSARNQAVHSERHAARLTSPRVAVPREIPFVLADQIKIGVVNDCDVAASYVDLTHGSLRAKLDAWVTALLTARLRSLVNQSQ